MKSGKQGKQDPKNLLVDQKENKFYLVWFYSS